MESWLKLLRLLLVLHCPLPGLGALALSGAVFATAMAAVELGPVVVWLRLGRPEPAYSWPAVIYDPEAVPTTTLNG